MEPDLVLEFEIEKGRSPDIENVARALLAWNEAVQAACSAISPTRKVVVELVGVEAGSQRYKQVFRILENAAEAVEEGGAEFPLIWKHTKALAKCIAGGVLVAVIANEVTSDSRQTEAIEEIRDILREDLETRRGSEDFYGIMQDEPAFTEILVYEGNAKTPIYSVPRSEFAFKSGLFQAGGEIALEQEDDRFGTWDVVLIRPVLVGKQRRWTFAKDGIEFSALMTDKAVLEAIHDQTLKIPFAEGVMMQVEVAYKVRFDGKTWRPINASRKVVRVLSPRVTLPPPGSLFSVTDTP